MPSVVASARIARAIYRVCEIPGAESPFDRAFLKIYYPALPDDSDEQRDAGIVPPDRSGAPFPLVVMMPGINVGPEAYAWLGTQLALQGIVTVTYSIIAEEMPGYVSLTPGLDLSAITPETYGTRPSATAVAAIIAAAEDENSAGLLEGCVDTARTVLAGHSAGGSVALFNANPDWFPQVCGAMAYGAHAGASRALGFADNTVLELPADVPLMLIAGTNDGVIASSGHRYGDTDGDAVSRVVQTFEDGMSSDRGDSYLVEVQGANHFSLAYPVDRTAGRHFLDGPEHGDGSHIRELLAGLFAGFVHDVTGDEGGRLAALENHELITTMRRR